MLPLYHDPWFTFRFADDRIIPRFHLEGVPPGTHVSVFKIDPDKGERLGLLATATVGDGGWVDLPQPLVVRAGEAFIAVRVGHQLTLTILPDTFAVCRLDGDAAIPAWATASGFSSITRTLSSDNYSSLSTTTIIPDRSSLRFNVNDNYFSRSACKLILPRIFVARYGSLAG